MPVAYYVMNRWLESFTQRVPLSAWVFVAACLLIILMTLVTVTVQSYRAANSNAELPGGEQQPDRLRTGRVTPF